MFCFFLYALCSHCWKEQEAILGQILSKLPLSYLVELCLSFPDTILAWLGTDLRVILLFIIYLSRGIPILFANKDLDFQTQTCAE